MNIRRLVSLLLLASGSVTIAGTINLSGAAGTTTTTTNIGDSRYPAMPGPGGFPGGVGAYLSLPATNGAGYGGVTTTTNGGSANYLYYSDQLVPLFGGAGGAGGQINNAAVGGNGGAGGGAIRIVSSSSIVIQPQGTINANGGGGGYGPNSSQYYGGPGAGGAIHLVAPTVTNNGSLSVTGGNGPVSTGGSGVIKISATNVPANNSAAVVGPLYNPPLPTFVSQVKVVSVNGVAAPADVMANVLAPDFTITTSGAVSINISAQYIPVGTGMPNEPSPINGYFPAVTHNSNNSKPLPDPWVRSGQLCRRRCRYLTGTGCGQWTLLPGLFLRNAKSSSTGILYTGYTNP